MNKFNYVLSIKPFEFNKLNDQLTICKCYVMALGKNRNLTYFSKESVDAALPTLPYQPVVAHLIYDKENDQYYVGGHDRAIEEGKLVDLTVPYGVVLDNSFQYEDVTESSGTMTTYLTCTVILWTGRYGAIMDATYDNNIYFGQSMEIIPREIAPYAEDKKYKDIRAFSFSALTLLGKSNDKEYHTEPCFPEASVVPFSEQNDVYDSDFDSKFNELKKEVEKINSELQIYSNLKNLTKKEEDNLEKKLEILKQYGFSVETIDFDINNFTEEEIETKLKEQATTLDDNKFELNMVEFINEIQNIVSEEKTPSPWDPEWMISKFWLVDIQGEEVIVEDTSDKFNLYAIPYTLEGDIPSLDFQGKIRVKTKYEHFEDGTSINSSIPNSLFEASQEYAEHTRSLRENLDMLQKNFEAEQQKHNDLKDVYEKLSKDFSNLNGSVEDEKKCSVLDNFSEKLDGNEEFEALKANRSDYSVESIEEKCFAIVGKTLAAQIDIPKKNSTLVNFSVDNQNSSKTTHAPYGGIREKYMNK